MEWCCIIPLAIVIAYALCCTWCLIDEFSQDEQSVAYWKRPPITDEQFLELVDPSVDPELALKVRDLISDMSGVSPENIYPDARLVQDLMLD